MSKKNRTSTELQNSIDYDFITRRNELRICKDIVEKNKNNIEGKVFAKNLIITLYAHWEGFIKYSSECYLQYLSHQNLKYSELDYGLLAISHIQKMKDFIESNVALKVLALKEIFSTLDDKADIPYNYAVATYSKLNTATLQEICLIIGIDENKYLLKKGIIDEKLVRVRNEIAHGNLKPISLESIIETYDLVFPIMEEFKNDIQNSVATVKYKITRNAN